MMKSRSSRAGKHDGIAGRGRHVLLTMNKQRPGDESKARSARGETGLVLLGLGRYFVIFSRKTVVAIPDSVYPSERVHIPAPT